MVTYARIWTEGVWWKWDEEEEELRNGRERKWKGEEGEKREGKGERKKGEKIEGEK